MLETRDILETINMIDNENLDVRTITMGISLLDCIDEDIDKACTKVYDKICRNAKDLVKTGEDIQKEFGGCNVYTKPACKECFARFYCSGGCAANGYHAHQDIRSNYEIGCELQRKRVECAIMIKAALACD